MTIDIRDLVTNKPTDALGYVRVSGDELPVVPFTSEGDLVDVHWLDGEELRGYMLCNGSNCILCAAGKKASQRVLLPVYNIASNRVEVLLVSTSLQPEALLPQLYQVLETDRPTGVLLSTQRRGRFTVSPFELQPDTETGEAKIQKFLDDLSEGKIDLKSVIQKVSNKQLSLLPDINRILQVKGISVEADNHPA